MVISVILAGFSGLFHAVGLAQNRKRWGIIGTLCSFLCFCTSLCAFALGYDLMQNQQAVSFTMDWSLIVVIVGWVFQLFGTVAGSIVDMGCISD